MYLEISKKLCWIAATILAGITCSCGRGFGDQPPDLLSNKDPITVELGNVLANSKPVFTFAVKNDLDTLWTLDKVVPSCSCQEVNVPSSCPIGDVIVGSGSVSLKAAKKSGGPFEYSIRVDGKPNGFLVNVRGNVENPIVVFPTKQSVKDGKSEFQLQIKPSTAYRVDHINITGLGIIGVPAQRIGNDGSVSATVKFDTANFDAKTTSTVIDVQAFDAASSNPIAEESVQLQFIDRTQSTPSKLVVHGNNREQQKQAVIITSGVEEWFDERLKVELKRDGVEQAEKVDFNVRRLKSNTAVLLIEINVPNNHDGFFEIKLRNEDKDWEYSIPIVIQN